MSVERNILKVRKPTVYIWNNRKGECLYVGSSDNPLNRVLHHNVIDIVEKVRNTDTIVFIHLETHNKMLEAEQILIKCVKPKYNKYRKRKVRNKSKILNAVWNGQKERA